MDLIEVLWKQDVDLGFSLEYYNNNNNNNSPVAEKQTASNDSSPEPSASQSGTSDEIEKIKILNELNAPEPGKVSFLLVALWCGGWPGRCGRGVSPAALRRAARQPIERVCSAGRLPGGDGVQEGARGQRGRAGPLGRPALHRGQRDRCVCDSAIPRAASGVVAPSGPVPLQ